MSAGTVAKVNIFRIQVHLMISEFIIREMMPRCNAAESSTATSNRPPASCIAAATATAATTAAITTT